MYGIEKNVITLLIHKSSAKTKFLLNLKLLMNTEWEPMYVINSVNEFTIDTSNQ
jgi:hypothetical protein